MIYSIEREAIRKTINFTWNDKNAKGRSPTCILIECLHHKLHFDEVRTLPDCSTTDEYSSY